MTLSHVPHVWLRRNFRRRSFSCSVYYQTNVVLYQSTANTTSSWCLQYCCNQAAPENFHFNMKRRILSYLLGRTWNCRRLMRFPQKIAKSGRKKGSRALIWTRFCACLEPCTSRPSSFLCVFLWGPCMQLRTETRRCPKGSYYRNRIASPRRIPKVTMLGLTWFIASSSKWQIPEKKSQLWTVRSWLYQNEFQEPKAHVSELWNFMQ